MMIILSNQKALLWNFPEIALQDRFQGNIPRKYIEVMVGLTSNDQVAEEIGKIVLEFVEKNKDIMASDLWREGKRLCSPKDLYNVLNQGLLWDFLAKNNTILDRSLRIRDHTIHFSE